MKNVYLDYAAATPIDPRVTRAMRYGESLFGNPGSLHKKGQAASAAIFKARRTFADKIGAKYDEIIFTGSATEANNLALKGAVEAFRNQQSTTNHQPPQIIVSAIEHESVLETARELEQKGVEVIFCPVSRGGLVDLKKLKGLLSENTILVSIGYANNEIGVIQPISKIATIIREFRNESGVRSTRGTKDAEKTRASITFKAPRTSTTVKTTRANYPLFHTDAVQAFQYLDCSVDKLGVDLMTLSAHKIYGPKGVGLLYIRNQELRIKNQAKQPEAMIHNSRFVIQPTIMGGGQEFGLRSGTENTTAILGFSEAVRISTAIREKEKSRLLKLRDFFWTKLNQEIPGLKLNGSILNRLPNNLNIYFPKMSAAELLVRLDLQGISVSAGSACRARQATPSYVIQALGYSRTRANHSLRFSFGRETRKSDLVYTARVLKGLLK
jgi:cysteine desulfurase